MPNVIVKKWRRLWGRCPYCKKKLEHAFAGMFLHGFYGCPDGHYGEEQIFLGGTFIYDRGGKIAFTPKGTS